MASPLVTVIIPTYNWSTVLPYSIRSVLAQTLRDFELLVVGDGCTDDSEAVVSAIDDPRVRWINLPGNTGHQSGPNNRGLREAKGEFVAYLGHDDLWLPHHLECMVAALQSTGAEVAYCIVGAVAPGADTVSPLMPMPQARSWAPPSGMMHRRAVTETTGGWTDYRALRGAPDVDFFRRIHSAGFRFEFVPHVTAIKFTASHRRNVYRERPCHEQAKWLERISADPHFEAAQLVTIMVSGESARAMPGRVLFPLALHEFVMRVRRRVSRKLWIARFCYRKGRGLDAIKSFKGLEV
jgi:GT2 family glycosyltransferase